MMFWGKDWGGGARGATGAVAVFNRSFFAGRVVLGCSRTRGAAST